MASKKSGGSTKKKKTFVCTNCGNEFEAAGEEAQCPTCGVPCHPASDIGIPMDKVVGEYSKPIIEALNQVRPPVDPSNSGLIDDNIYKALEDWEKIELINSKALMNTLMQEKIRSSILNAQLEAKRKEAELKKYEMAIKALENGEDIMSRKEVNPYPFPAFQPPMATPPIAPPMMSTNPVTAAGLDQYIYSLPEEERGEVIEFLKKHAPLAALIHGAFNQSAPAPTPLPTPIPTAPIMSPQPVTQPPQQQANTGNGNSHSNTSIVEFAEAMKTMVQAMQQLQPQQNQNDDEKLAKVLEVVTQHMNEMNDKFTKLMDVLIDRTNNSDTNSQLLEILELREQLKQELQEIHRKVEESQNPLKNLEKFMEVMAMMEEFKKKVGKMSEDPINTEYLLHKEYIDLQRQALQIQSELEKQKLELAAKAKLEKEEKILKKFDLFKELLDKSLKIQAVQQLGQAMQEASEREEQQKKEVAKQVQQQDVMAI